MSQSKPSSHSAASKPSSNGSTGANASGKQRMLIVLPKWVGDLVLATPALKALRQQFPDHHMTYLVRSHLSEVLSGFEGMDEVIHWPTGKSKSKRREGLLGLSSKLRKQQFDMAVLLANSFRSALLARLAGIPRRIGYDRDGRGLLLTDKLLPQKADGKYVPIPMTRYYNAIARYLGCREVSEQPELIVSPKEESAAAQVLADAGVQTDQPVVIINPGASYGPAKCWLPQRFAEVADSLVRENHAAVFISCGPKEVDVARKVAGSMKEKATVLADPVLPLGPLKALIRRASLLITNDTGPRHFANALGTSAVTIFGPTDPQWTQTDSPNERMLIVEVDCGPCMKRTCPLDHRCMTRISGDLVLEKARELLSGRPATTATSG